jgi:hypothetical protein
MSKSQSDWEAESDARTLAEANEIRKDPKRHKRAVEWAKRQMENIAGVVAEQPTGGNTK